MQCDVFDCYLNRTFITNFQTFLLTEKHELLSLLYIKRLQMNCVPDCMFVYRKKDTQTDSQSVTKEEKKRRKKEKKYLYESVFCACLRVYIIKIMRFSQWVFDLYWEIAQNIEIHTHTNTYTNTNTQTYTHMLTGKYKYIQKHSYINTDNYICAHKVKRTGNCV